jgi:hypothetical protein
MTLLFFQQHLRLNKSCVAFATSCDAKSATHTIGILCVAGLAPLDATTATQVVYSASVLLSE